MTGLVIFGPGAGGQQNKTDRGSRIQSWGRRYDEGSEPPGRNFKEGSVVDLGQGANMRGKIPRGGNGFDYRPRLKRPGAGGCQRGRIENPAWARLRSGP